MIDVSYPTRPPTNDPGIAKPNQANEQKRQTNTILILHYHYRNDLALLSLFHSLPSFLLSFSLRLPSLYREYPPHLNPRTISSPSPSPTNKQKRQNERFHLHLRSMKFQAILHRRWTSMGCIFDKHVFVRLDGGEEGMGYGRDDMKWTIEFPCCFLRMRMNGLETCGINSGRPRFVLMMTRWKFNTDNTPPSSPAHFASLVITRIG